MAEPTQEIKERLDIVEFLRGYMPLKPAGKNFKAACPFHKERTPSFMVSPERQSWKCFGCGAGGDIFTFLMQYEHIEFAEALRILAEKAGVELRRVSPASYKEYGIFYDINEAAKDFFKNLLRQSSQSADYLKTRGLKTETVETFDLGLAPSSPDELTVSLINLGYDVNDLVRAGVTLRSEKGFYLDRFRNRLMFPIHNHAGKIAGFTGRILPAYENADIGKYVNSPETPIFSKSRLLYGWHKTKNDIRERNEAVLVEGQMDFLMSWQDGVKNIVATSGTALTADHLKVLRRLSSRLVLHFDNDDAGALASERSIDLASASDFDVRIVQPPRDCKDPAEIAQKHPGLLVSLIEQAQPAMQYYFRQYLSDFEAAQLVERKQKIRQVLAKIKNIASAVEQSQWVHQLSERTKIEEKNLVEEMDVLPEVRQLTDAPHSGAEFKIIPQAPVLASNNRKALIAERLLGLALGANQLSEIRSAVEYFPPHLRAAYETLANSSPIPAAVEGVLNAIHLQSDWEIEKLGANKTAAAIDELMINLEQEYFRERQKELAVMIRQLSDSGSEDKLRAALQELDNVSKKIHNIH
ncbi:MAG: DNA primase [Parcubacteria group bacterium]|nr:DNA primase [Parcubacteria group bacterium]